MTLKDYIRDVLAQVTLGTVVDFEVYLYPDTTVADEITGNKVSFSVIKDNASTTLKVAN